MDEQADPYRELMLAARASVADDRIDDAARYFQAALAIVRREEHHLGVVTTLIEYGIALAVRGRSDDGAEQVYEAELIALECGFATNTGLFALAHGKIWSARGEHATSAEHFLRAAEEFRAIERDEQATYAMSRRAHEIEELGDADAAIAAHAEVVEALLNLPSPPTQLKGFLGLHRENIAHLHRGAGRPIKAQQAFCEARDYWVEVGNTLAAARCDLSVGDIYVQLECCDLALTIYEGALAMAMAEDDSEIATETIGSARARIEALNELGNEPGHEAGPTLA